MKEIYNCLFVLSIFIFVFALSIAGDAACRGCNFCWKGQLRYESSTLLLYKELSSTIFQSCQWVSQSGMRDTLPDLHFVQYIKA